MQKFFFPLLFLFLLAACKDASKAEDPLAETGRTQRTENLLSSLKRIAAEGYMFGHQDSPMYGIGWVGDSARSDVKDVCNDFPAVMGFDLGHLELGDSLNLDGVPFDRMRQRIIEQYDRGGIVTISWHLDNPLTGKSAWVNPDSLTDVEKQTVASVLEGGKQHEKFLGWLDSVADFLNSLVTPYGVKVPVIFRPWHEHTGSWFWWGKNLCSKEQYTALWQLTASQLKEKGVTNALLAYSPGASPLPPTEQRAYYLDRYPGDEIIDLLGLDIYCNAEYLAGYQQDLDFWLTTICAIAKEKQKPCAVTETGFMDIPMENWWTEVLAPVLNSHELSYVLVWRNNNDDPKHCFAPYPGQISAEDFVRFYNLSKTLFLKDIQGVYLKKETRKADKEEEKAKN